MMTRSFLCISLLLIVALSSCSKKIYTVGGDASPIVRVDENTQKYNLKMDFMKNQMSGILIFKKMESGEIRILATTLFGLSLFDFGLKGEEWQVYNCLEPMRKKRVLDILENDFKLLFLSDRKVNKIENKGDHTQYTVGSWLSKSVTEVYSRKGNSPDNIVIKHPWIRLTLEFDKIEEEKNVGE